VIEFAIGLLVGLMLGIAIGRLLLLREWESLIGYAKASRREAELKKRMEQE